MKNIVRELTAALLATAALLVLVSGAYPLAVWGLSQLTFPQKANGSLVRTGGKSIGSRWIGQDFHSPRYFHPRPSAAGNGYDAASSGGSNLGPTSQKLMDSVKARVARYRMENNLSPDILIPADAVMASGSGLDPEISLDNANLQIKRVATARGMDEARLRKLVAPALRKRDFGLLGEPGVNVLILNLSLDQETHE
jgi:potassium-transporting ATPase KdpC subunit